MGILAFLTSALYWPGVAGAATVPRWVVIAFVAPCLLNDHRLTAPHVAGGLFLAWAFLTLLWDPVPLDGFGAMLVMLMLACCFLSGYQAADLRPVYIGAGLGLTISSIIAVVQCFGFHPVGSWGLESGLFVNGAFMAEAAALILVAAVAERIWWLVPGLLPALLLPDARTAVLAAAAGIVVCFRRSKIAWLMVCAVPVGCGLYVAAKGYGSIDERLAIWHSALDGTTLVGHGIGSFWSVYPSYDLRPPVPIGLWSTPEFAHNEFLHFAFELGIVGLLLFCSLCATLAGPIDTARLVLIALFVESCFDYPLHLPVTGFLGMVAAGHAVRNRYLLWGRFGWRRDIGKAGLARS
jgi:hypothetical protein